jgi:AhpC/TSA family
MGKLFTVLAGLILIGCTPAWCEPLGMGERFPEVPLPVPVQAGARAYLGLPAGETFTLSQVKADVVLVEMLNVLCPHCRKQTKPYNRLFQMLQKDPELRDKVKMLGVAVANSAEQIADFVDIYAVAYPIAADRSFALHQAVRGGPTPLSIYVLQDPAGGPGVVAGSSLGEDDQMEQLLAYLVELTGMQLADFEGLAEPVVIRVPPLPISRPDLERRIRSALGRYAGEVVALKSLPNVDVYQAEVVRQGRREKLYARVVSRSAICDICHDVHFFYIFNRQGEVVALEPIHLTKYGNVEWSAAEAAGFVKRILGRSLLDPWDFDPRVDAVTSATMTSAIIYNSLAQDRQLLKQLTPLGE